MDKIKCAAKALACGLACSYFNFAKDWFLSSEVRTEVGLWHGRTITAVGSYKLKSTTI